MSGTTPITPSGVDTTQIQDGQGVGAIVPLAIRTMNDSLASMAIASTQAGTTYTFVATDFSALVRFSSSSAVTVTVPANIFKAGNVVYGRAVGSGQVTIVAGSSLTLNVPVTLSLTPVQWATWAIHFESTTVAVLM